MHFVPELCKYNFTLENIFCPNLNTKSIISMIFSVVNRGLAPGLPDGLFSKLLLQNKNRHLYTFSGPYIGQS
jgi:hypothetical protein